MTSNSLGDKLLLACLAVLIVLDGGLWAYVKIAPIYNPQDPNLFYASSDHSPAMPPTGFTGDDQRTVAVSSASRGWAVRYASTNCHFCRDDQKRWSGLAEQLADKGYQIVTIVPDSQESYSADGLVPKASVQQAYVDLGWLKNFRLSATPTLLLFDSKHGLIWAHKGTLSIADPIDAMHKVSYWEKH